MKWVKETIKYYVNLIIARTRVRKADVWSEDKLKERLFQLFEDNDSVSFDSLREKTNAAKVNFGNVEKFIY